MIRPVDAGSAGSRGRERPQSQRRDGSTEPDEAQELWTLPGWPQRFQYPGRIPGALRVPGLLGKRVIAASVAPNDTPAADTLPL